MNATGQSPPVQPGTWLCAFQVADHEPVEAEAALQHVGQQALVAVHLDAVPGGEARHHRHRAGIDAGNVAGRVDVDEVLLGDPRVALIGAAFGAAIGKEVLHRRRDLALLDAAFPRLALQAAHHGGGIGAGDVGKLRVTLIAAAPAVVARHRDCRREGPVDTGGGGLGGGHRADSPR